MDDVFAQLLKFTAAGRVAIELHQAGLLKEDGGKGLFLGLLILEDSMWFNPMQPEDQAIVKKLEDLANSAAMPLPETRAWLERARK